MKRFTVPCDFSGTKYPFHVYVGEPSDDCHPLKFQEAWLRSVRGGKIPDDVMDSFGRLHKIAKENNVSFEELCVYALGTAAQEEAKAKSADS
jgi:hypothetical protein